MYNRNDTESILSIILLLVTGYLSWLYYVNKEHEYVMAGDGKPYRVQIGEDNKQAANLLSKAISRVKTLLAHLQKIEPNDFRTETLSQRFNPDNITENAPSERENGTTSYTVNKGEKIVVCLRQKNGDFVDINTLMYVIVHELAHISDVKSHQHDERFWKNFEWLLSHSIDIGIYTYVDYKKEEEPYCGMNITSNVIDDY